MGAEKIVLKKVAIVWSLLALLFFSEPVSAGEPTAQLSATINEFVAILVNTPVAELQSDGLPEKALQLIFSRFDFSEMTRRALGAHWKSMEQRQQQEFVDAFTQKLLVGYGRTVRASGECVPPGRWTERPRFIAWASTGQPCASRRRPITGARRAVS